MAQDLNFILPLLQPLSLIVVVTAYVVLTRSKSEIVEIRLESINARLETLTKSFATLADIRTEIVEQNMRIAYLKRDMDELRRGKGWVDVDGEYTTKVERK